jgi:hypothetical protein
MDLWGILILFSNLHKLIPTTALKVDIHNSSISNPLENLDQGLS